MKQTKQNKISELQSTGGRFTSLTVNKGGRKVSYCAQIRKVSDSTVSFFDVNKAAMRRVPIESVVLN